MWTGALIEHLLSAWSCADASSPQGAARDPGFSGPGSSVGCSPRGRTLYSCLCTFQEAQTSQLFCLHFTSARRALAAAWALC